jgi:small subunit ribosomal protein S9
MQEETQETRQKKEYIWGTGRRKTAVARVRIHQGKGKFMVNGRRFDEYFFSEQDRVIALSPLQAMGISERFDVFANVCGGGISAQAEAVRLGIARALRLADPSLEERLKEEKMLTRDPRMKERKKFGLRGARRGVQYSKR